MINIKQLNIRNYCVFGSVDAWNATTDFCLAFLLHIFSPALFEHSYCQKIPSVP